MTSMEIGLERVGFPKLQGDFTPEGRDCKNKSYNWLTMTFPRQNGKGGADFCLLKLCHSGTIR
jgi:hypothetical protein